MRHEPLHPADRRRARHARANRVWYGRHRRKRLAQIAAYAAAHAEEFKARKRRIYQEQKAQRATEDFSLDFEPYDL